MDSLSDDLLLRIVYSVIQNTENYQWLIQFRCTSKRLGWIVQYYLDIILQDPITWMLDNQCKPALSRWIKELPLQSSFNANNYFVKKWLSRQSEIKGNSYSLIESLLHYTIGDCSSISFFLWMWDQLYKYTNVPLQFKTQPTNLKLPSSFLFQNNTASHISLYIEYLSSNVR